MACNNNKIEDSCLEKQFATCVKYEGELPEWSVVDDCSKNIENTTEELYNIITEIREDLDNSDLDSDCLDLRDKSQKEINKELLLAICEAKEELLLLGGDFRLCDIDYGDLLDGGPCDVGKPSTICEFAQFIVDILKERL